ncbi:MAG: stage III sporulation protein AE [Clostridiales bacterium]|nr:stage III sporulation protein AE [Clostridiales bacterium]
MRRICVAALLLLTCLSLTGTALAAGAPELPEALTEQADLEGLERAARGQLGETSLTAGMSLEDGLLAILDRGGQAAQGAVRRAVGAAVKLLIVVLLCGLAEGMQMAGTEEGLPVVSVVGALAVTALSLGELNALVGMGREAIDSMSLFSKTLLPTMATVVAASGAPMGGAVRQLATLMFSDVLLTLINRLLVPLIYLYVAACTARAAVGNEGLKRLAAMIKSIVVTSLTILLMAFIGYITVSGVIAGSADALTVKAAKFTISGMVPVVGGILSDAAETVLAGAGILRDTVGVFGMLVVLSVCVVPFLTIGVQYLAYKVTAALSATVGAGRVVDLIDNIGGAFALVLGMTGTCALILLVSLISAISMVTP